MTWRRGLLLLGSGIVALLVFYTLDAIDGPSWVTITADRLVGIDLFYPLFTWVNQIGQRWGDVLTFGIGLVIGYLVPTTAEKRTAQISDYIRGNLLTFDEVYKRVCELLEEIQDDPRSCFIAVTHSPLFGVDRWGMRKHQRGGEMVIENRYAELLGARATRQNRMLCLPPLADQDGHYRKNFLHSRLGEFCMVLHQYEVTRRSRKLIKSSAGVRPAEWVFEDSCAFLQQLSTSSRTDVIFQDDVPYQIFLARRSTGGTACVMLLTGQTALASQLPVGGFHSRDATFIRLMERSLKALLGTRDVWELSQEHTKTIVEEGLDYSMSVGLPASTDEVDLTKLKTVVARGHTILRYPFVFNPVSGDSVSIVSEAVERAVDSAVKRNAPATEGGKATETVVLDIGCGSGVQSFNAIRKGATKVIAVDTNSFAVESTRHNAKHLKMDDRIDVRLGDIFEPIEEADGRADVIVADLPFVGTVYQTEGPSQALADAYFDYRYGSLHRTLEAGQNYLKPNGVLICGFSNIDSDLSVSRLLDVASELKWTIKKFDAKAGGFKWYAFELRRQ